MPEGVMDFGYVEGLARIQRVNLASVAASPPSHSSLFCSASKNRSRRGKSLEARPSGPPSPAGGRVLELLRHGRYSEATLSKGPSA